MSYWHGLLIGLLVGGTLGTIAMGLVVSCRLNDDVEEKDKECIVRK